MRLMLEGLLLQVITDLLVRMLYQLIEWCNSYPWWSLLT